MGREGWKAAISMWYSFWAQRFFEWNWLKVIPFVIGFGITSQSGHSQSITFQNNKLNAILFFFFLDNFPSPLPLHIHTQNANYFRKPKIKAREYRGVGNLRGKSAALFTLQAVYLEPGSGLGGREKPAFFVSVLGDGNAGRQVCALASPTP